MEKGTKKSFQISVVKREREREKTDGKNSFRFYIGIEANVSFTIHRKLLSKITLPYYTRSVNPFLEDNESWLANDVRWT